MNNAARTGMFDGSRVREVLPGLAVAGTIGLAAAFLAEHYGGPIMVWALLFGMAFHFLSQEGRCVAGIQLASTTVLRIGVMLLGARITVNDVESLGLGPVLVVVAGVALTLVFGLWLAQRLGLSKELGVLTGGSVAICGASAAMALATVLPRREDAERDTLLTVVAVTTLSSIAMVLYPMLGHALGLDAHQAGVFLGGTIHDVAQVMGAGETYARMNQLPATVPAATIMKLLRVAMLVPVVFVVTLGFRRREVKLGLPRNGARPPILPWFLVGFVALALVSSFGYMPTAVGALASDVSRICLVAAVAAVGMKTALAKLVEVGWRPAALIVAETLLLGGLVLGALLLMPV